MDLPNRCQKIGSVDSYFTIVVTFLLAVDQTGKTWITYEDFSIALLDEVEHPKHIRERFAVSY